MIAPIKRKSLPEIAKVVSINSAQSLHYFIVNSDWSVDKLKSKRLNKVKNQLKGKAISVVIDETGDGKKGKKIDYVARQYLGSVGKVENGIVSVNAYGVYHNITFSLRGCVRSRKALIGYMSIEKPTGNKSNETILLHRFKR